MKRRAVAPCECTVYHAQRTQDSLLPQDVKKVGEIVPAICIAWLLLSALVAFLYFLVWSFSLCTARRAARSSKAGAKPRVPFVSSLLWSLLAPILG